MLIFLRTLTDCTTFLIVEPDELVESLKSKVYAKEGVPPEFQRLNFGDLELKNKHSLDFYKIKEDSRLHLSLLNGLRVSIRNPRKQLACITLQRDLENFEKVEERGDYNNAEQILMDYDISQRECVHSFFEDVTEQTITLRVALGADISRVRAKIRDLSGTFADYNVNVDANCRRRIRRTLVVHLKKLAS